VELFFELIQVALGHREILSRDPSDAEWNKLFLLCQIQAIVGVAFEALDGLSKHGQKPPIQIIYKWIALSEQLKQQNMLVNKNVVELFQMLKKDGLDSCILKGQGNNLLYPNPYSRTPGDIDVWSKPIDGGRGLKADIREVIGYVKKKSPESYAVYHHIVAGDYNGTEVEVHYRPSHMYNPIHNKRLQQWFELQSMQQFCHEVDLPDGVGIICVPTSEFNIVFQLSHIYNHLLHEGIGLRQVIDYYYVLLSIGSSQWAIENCTATLLRLGLLKIAGAMMWILSNR